MNRLLFLISAILTSGSMLAQSNQTLKQKLTEKASFGGSFGLGFGSITYVNLSPSIGYRFTERFTAGVGELFQYVSYNKSVYGYDYHSTVFGERVFGRYRFLENVYGMAEYQNLHIQLAGSDNLHGGRASVPVLFVGAGYLSNLGGRVYANLAILYDLNQDINSPYTNPVFQAGIIVNP